MAKTLANLDYLLNRPSVSSSQAPKEAVSADQAIQAAAAAWGQPILGQLYRDPQGKRSAFELVDTLNIRLEDLFSVLDVLSKQFRWVDVNRNDPKGNYQISLTDVGREIARQTINK